MKPEGVQSGTSSPIATPSALVYPAFPPQVLPAVYLFVGRSLNATPVQLGTLTLCRAMVQVCTHVYATTVYLVLLQ